MIDVPDIPGVKFAADYMKRLAVANGNREEE